MVNTFFSIGHHRHCHEEKEEERNDASKKKIINTNTSRSDEVACRRHPLSVQPARYASSLSQNVTLRRRPVRPKSPIAIASAVTSHQQQRNHEPNIYGDKMKTALRFGGVGAGHRLVPALVSAAIVMAALIFIATKILIPTYFNTSMTAIDNVFSIHFIVSFFIIGGASTFWASNIRFEPFRVPLSKHAHEGKRGQVQEKQKAGLPTPTQRARDGLVSKQAIESQSERNTVDDKKQTNKFSSMNFTNTTSNAKTATTSPQPHIKCGDVGRAEQISRRITTNKADTKPDIVVRKTTTKQQTTSSASHSSPQRTISQDDVSHIVRSDLSNPKTHAGALALRSTAPEIQLGVQIVSPTVLAKGLAEVVREATATNNSIATRDQVQVHGNTSFSSSDDGLPLSPTGYISFLQDSSSSRSDVRTVSGSSTHSSTLQPLMESRDEECSHETTKVKESENATECETKGLTEMSVSDMEVTLDSSLSSMIHETVAEMEEASKRMRLTMVALNAMKGTTSMLKNRSDGSEQVSCEENELKFLPTSIEDPWRLAVERMKRPIAEMDDDIDEDSSGDGDHCAEARNDVSSFFSRFMTVSKRENVADTERVSNSEERYTVENFSRLFDQFQNKAQAKRNDSFDNSTDGNKTQGTTTTKKQQDSFAAALESLGVDDKTILKVAKDVENSFTAFGAMVADK